MALRYVNRSLVVGEQVLHQGRFRWLFTLAMWIWMIPPFTPVGLVMLIWKRSTEIAITNRRLIYKRGWIARKTDEINLGRLEEVNLQQGIFGRIFGYGRVVCHGVGSGQVRLPVIGRPVAFRRAIQEAQALKD